MKKYLLIIPLLTITGCDSVEIERGYKGSKKIYTYSVRGKPLECIKASYRSLSCNWEKYNNL